MQKKVLRLMSSVEHLALKESELKQPDECKFEDYVFEAVIDIQVTFGLNYDRGRDCSGLLS